VEHNISLP
jgi:hypothetical protein